jgi:hypothetical protein
VPGFEGFCDLVFRWFVVQFSEESLMGILSNAKDRLIEQVALSYLNGKLLAPYGRATSLRIDSTAKSLSVEAELNGEKSPIRIDVAEYEIGTEGDRYFVKVRGIKTSREWLTTLARNELSNIRFEVPEQLGRLLLRAL